MFRVIPVSEARGVDDATTPDGEVSDDTAARWANCCGALLISEAIGVAAALFRRIVVPLRKDVGAADREEKDGARDGNGIADADAPLDEDEREIGGVGTIVTKIVLTTVSVVRTVVGTWEESEEEDKLELLGRIEDCGLGLGTDETEEDNETEDESEALGPTTSAPPRNGVGTTVELGLGGGTPLGYESSKISS